jgi:hypothetical protein
MEAIMWNKKKSFHFKNGETETICKLNNISNVGSRKIMIKFNELAHKLAQHGHATQSPLYTE